MGGGETSHFLLCSLTFTLLELSPHTHCHPHNPPPPNIQLFFIVVFAQEGRKSAYPTQRCEPVSHKVHLCVRVCVCELARWMSTLLPHMTHSNVCAHTVNTACVCVRVCGFASVHKDTLPVPQGQTTFLWKQDHRLLTPFTGYQIC